MSGPATRAPLPLLLVACLTIALPGCGGADRRIATPSAVDKKLSRFAFAEDGKLVALIVSTRATTFRESQSYMPVEICVANRGVDRITMTLESFTLVDDQGNRYPAATPRELLAGYNLLDQDRERFAELFGLVSTRFSAFDGYPSKLSPTRQGRTVQDRVQLPRSGVMFDFIYFPMPPGGLEDRRFELFLDTPELESPIFVRFVVP